MVNYCSLKGVLAGFSKSRWQGWLKRSSERRRRLTHGAAISLGAGKPGKVYGKARITRSAIKNLVKRPIYSRNTRYWGRVKHRWQSPVDLSPESSVETPKDHPPVEDLQSYQHNYIRLPDDIEHQPLEEEVPKVEHKKENPQQNAENDNSVESNSLQEIPPQILNKQ